MFVFRSCLVPVSDQALTTVMKGTYVSPHFLKTGDVAVSTGSGRKLDFFKLALAPRAIMREEGAHWPSPTQSTPFWYAWKNGPRNTVL
jgi:hypothetical protein